MKNLIFGLILVFSICSLSASTLCITQESGGIDIEVLGPNGPTGEWYCGYSEVNTLVDYDQVNDINSILVTCIGEGNVICQANTSLGIICRYDDLKKHADDAIRNGNLTGNYVNNIYENGNLFYRSVSWSSTGLHNISTITINLNQAVQP